MGQPSFDVDFDRLEELCRRYGIARLDVFGSLVGEDARPDSDIDLLYELAPGRRLGWHIESLASELSELFGRPVDLVSTRALHAALRGQVLAAARPLYAA